MIGHICFVGSDFPKSIGEINKSGWNNIPNDAKKEFINTLALDDIDVLYYLEMSKKGRADLFWRAIDQAEASGNKSLRRDSTRLVKLFQDADLKMNEKYGAFKMKFPETVNEIEMHYFQLLAVIVFGKYSSNPLLTSGWAV